MRIDYTPKGVCATKILIDVENGIVNDVKFVNGCSGNGQGVSNLIKGMKVEDVIEKLENIKCGSRQSSCPAQLTRALKQIIGKE